MIVRVHVAVCDYLVRGRSWARDPRGEARCWTLFR